MKKTTLALVVAIASLSSVANATLPEDSWYVGGKFGWSKFFGTEAQKVAYKDGTNTINAEKVTNNRVGFGGFVGYQATPYLAAELGYDWLGKLTYYKDNKGKKIGALTLHGASLTGKASLPISDDFDIYARAGAFIHTTKWNAYDKDANRITRKSDTDVSPTYALGVDYHVNDDFSTRLEYQWISNIDNGGPVRPDNALLSFAVTYRLGGSSSATKVADLQYRENRYVLSEDILFDYNKSALKADGKIILDNLIKTLVKIKPSESAIVVIGHTDRIGTVNYNQKLSEKRAKSVTNYLLSKGAPSNLITTRGVGKTRPVTGNSCRALKGADLKACLAPDRRVEIEIKAKVEEAK